MFKDHSGQKSKEENALTPSMQIITLITNQPKEQGRQKLL